MAVGELGFPVASPSTPSKRGLRAVGMAFGGVFLGLGTVMLLVPIQNPSLPYDVCHDGWARWFGCVTGLNPLAPYVLVLLGAAIIYGLSRRRQA